jgi:hypothetical protein
MTPPMLGLAEIRAAATPSLMLRDGVDRSRPSAVGN